MENGATAFEASCTNNNLPCFMSGEMKMKDTEMTNLAKVECEGLFGDEVDSKVVKKYVLFQKQNKAL